MTLEANMIWASLPVPAFVIDGDNRIADINPAAEVFLNATIRGLRGRKLTDKLIIDAPIEDGMARVRLSQSPLFVNDVRVETWERGGTVSTVQVAPLSESSDGLLVLIAPREMAGRIGRATTADKAAKSAIGMAEMLAHEIKNPLAGITGAAQLLSMSLSNGDLELTDLIVAESRRIVKLLDQVEQFGNLRPPACHALNIHDLLDRAKTSAMVGYAQHMTFVEEYDPSLPLTWADGDQLLQVFLNLLKNASEAADPEGGVIKIRSYYDPSLRIRDKDGAPLAVPLQVEIADNGPGLPPDLADTIFEPFVSGRENGTGLGLALVSKIIGDHNGWISVESKPGRTVFRISLPVAPRTGDPTQPKEAP